jgi:hypothetical protein
MICLKDDSEEVFVKKFLMPQQEFKWYTVSSGPRSRKDKSQFIKL